MATKKEATTKKTTTAKKPVAKKPVTKKEIKKTAPVKKAMKKNPPKPPVKKPSRRLTNKERDVVSAVLISYMLIPEFDAKSEDGKNLISALDKIRVV